MPVASVSHTLVSVKINLSGNNILAFEICLAEKINNLLVVGLFVVRHFKNINRIVITAGSSVRFRSLNKTLDIFFLAPVNFIYKIYGIIISAGFHQFFNLFTMKSAIRFIQNNHLVCLSKNNTYCVSLHKKTPYIVYHKHSRMSKIIAIKCRKDGQIPQESALPREC